MSNNATTNNATTQFLGTTWDPDTDKARLLDEADQLSTAPMGGIPRDPVPSIATITDQNKKETEGIKVTVVEYFDLTDDQIKEAVKVAVGDKATGSNQGNNVIPRLHGLDDAMFPKPGNGVLPMNLKWAKVHKADFYNAWNGLKNSNGECTREANHLISDLPNEIGELLVCIVKQMLDQINDFSFINDVDSQDFSGVVDRKTYKNFSDFYTHHVNPVYKKVVKDLVKEGYDGTQLIINKAVVMGLEKGFLNTRKNKTDPEKNNVSGGQIATMAWCAVSLIKYLVKNNLVNVDDVNEDYKTGTLAQMIIYAAQLCVLAMAKRGSKASKAPKAPKTPKVPKPRGPLSDAAKALLRTKQELRWAEINGQKAEIERLKALAEDYEAEIQNLTESAEALEEYNQDLSNDLERVTKTLEERVEELMQIRQELGCGFEVGVTIRAIRALKRELKTAQSQFEGLRAAVGEGGVKKVVEAAETTQALQEKSEDVVKQADASIAASRAASKAASAMPSRQSSRQKDPKDSKEKDPKVTSTLDAVASQLGKRSRAEEDAAQMPPPMTRRSSARHAGQQV